MKILAKQNRELIMTNAQNTQNENDAEKITLQVPEQYEDFNKKIVFVTPDGIVWDLIVNDEYLIPKAITKYKQVDLYIWLTKGDVDFRSQTRTLKFYHNVDASGEITPEEISGVNTVVNLLEEEITKVNNLETEIDGKLEEIDTAIDNVSTAIQETENLDLDAEKVGQTTTITLTKKDGTVKTVHVDDGEKGEKGDKGEKGEKGEKGDTYDDTELKNDISKIKEEQTTQNGNITKNADEITNLKNENAYLQNVVKQAFTETTASGTELTIDNTIEARMDLKLKGNTKQQQYSGKNLVKLYETNNAITNSGLSYDLDDDGKLSIKGTTNRAWDYSISKPIYFEVGKTYTFSVIFLNIANNTTPPVLYLSLSANNGGQKAISKFSTSITFTIKELQKIPIMWSMPKNLNVDFSLKLQIEEGSTATDYEPYVGGTASPNPDYPQDINVVTGDNTITISNSDNTEKQEFPISLGSLELCKIGDYQDSIVKDNGKWYLNKQIGKVVLDGSENWNKGTTAMSDNTYFYTGKYDNLIGWNTYLMYSDNFKQSTTFLTPGYNKEGNVISGPDPSATSGFRLRILISNSTGSTTLNDFKTWLSTHNTIVYYVLATPTITEITDTTLITQLDEISQALSKKGTTIISQNNDDLPFNLDVIALTK